MLPVWGFLAVTVPLVMTPGLSTAVVLRNSVTGGVRAGLATAAGVNAGSACYGLLSAGGLALAMHRWPSAWVVLRIAGTIYIAWLGLQSVRRALDGGTPPAAIVDPAAGRSSLGHLYEGFVTNTLNPAIATFYLVVVPQFVPLGAPVGRSILILTGIHVLIAGSLHVGWATAGGSLAHILSRPRPRQILEMTAGVTLIVMAGKLAMG